MARLYISSHDIKNHFKKNGNFYFGFLGAILVGILIGITVIISSDSYVNVLSSSSKVLYSYINGTAHMGVIFWRNLVSFIVPMLLIFILNLNLFSGLISYIIVAYQSAMLLITSSALILIYGLSGVLNVLLILLPINMLYILALVYFSVVCLERGAVARAYKHFAYGFNSSSFWLKILAAFVMVLIITLVASILYPIFIKNAILVIF